MSVRLEVLSSLASVDPTAWNALVDPDDPFMEYGFLRLLETSESVGPRETGWLPRHIVAYDGERLLGALPLYLKTHSYGEFIFDFGWAQAAMRAGMRYYPKLVCAVPLTPASGRRILTHMGEQRAPTAELLLQAARELTRQSSASSLHVLFCRPDETALLEQAGLHVRQSYQYHLIHDGSLGTFADFSAALRNASRKQVRKERERAQAQGLTLTMRPFAALSSSELEAMDRFYRQTVENHGGEAYLSPSFFAGLTHDPHAYAAMAHDAGEPVAGALFMHKGKALFGRYWGADRDYPNLHFELCYYLPLEWGFARGVRRFEAGAQGEHKIKRGFLPNACYSGHWAVHPGLDHGIAEFVREEQGRVREDMAYLAESTPFKRVEADGAAREQADE